MKTHMTARRTVLKPLAALALLPLAACAAGVKMKKTIALNLIIRNYTDRDIFAINLNGRYDEGAPPYNSGTSVYVDATFDLGGPQTLKWRDSGTGATTTAKNPLYIREEDMPKGVRYLCIHIYPDEMAELTFTVGRPVPTARGAIILKETGNE